MSVQINALGAEEEPYYKLHETDVVLPPEERRRIVGTVTYSPLPAQAPSVAPAVPEVITPGSQFYRTSRCGWFCRNRTAVLIGAGVVAVGGLVTWMMLRPTRGIRPAVAGLHGRRRRRRRR